MLSVNNIVKRNYYLQSKNMPLAITYHYSYDFEVVFAEGETTRVNLPMYRESIKVFPGVSNSINFVARDRDRKPIKLMNKNLMVTFKDQITNEELFRKFVEIVNDRKGLYKLNLSIADLEGVEPGYYTFSVILIDEQGSESLLYTDTANNAVGIVEVVDKPLEQFRPTTEINGDQFTEEDTGNNIFTTGRFRGGSSIGSKDGLHTLAIYLDNWSGDFTVEGSLDLTPQLDSDWFEIQTTSYTEYSGISLQNFIGQFSWVRFKISPSMTNMGELEKVLFRF